MTTVPARPQAAQQDRCSPRQGWLGRHIFIPVLVSGGLLVSIVGASIAYQSAPHAWAHHMIAAPTAYGPSVPCGGIDLPC